MQGPDINLSENHPGESGAMLDDRTEPAPAPDEAAFRLGDSLQAARRLIASGRPLVEAALESGFHDQSHMTRLFVRIHGYSPGAFARAAV